MGIRDLVIAERLIELKHKQMVKQGENQFDIILKANDVAQEDSVVLKTAFGELDTFLEKYRRINESIEVTDISHKAEMKLADQARKELKSKRTQIEKVRKETGGKYYAMYKAINAVAAHFKDPIAALEEQFTEKAEFEEREKARIELEKKNEWVQKFREKADKIILLSDITGIPEQEINQMFEDAIEEKLEKERIAREIEEQRQQADSLRKKNEKLLAEKKRYEDRVGKLARSDIHYNPDIEMYSYDDKGFFSQDDLSILSDQDFTSKLSECIIFVGKRKAEKQKKAKEEADKIELERRNQIDENLLKTRDTTSIVDNFEAGKKNSDYHTLGELARAFKNYKLPEMKTKRGRKIIEMVKTSLDKLPPWLEEIREKRKSEL